MTGEVERAKTVEVTEGRVTGMEERREEVGGWGEREEGNAEEVRREERLDVDRVEGRVVVEVEGIMC
jgi:hypothetical protein